MPRSREEIIARYTAGVSGAAGTRWEERAGSSETANKWKTNTSASAANYNSRMSEVIAENRFGAGIDRTSPSKFAAGVAGKGGRWQTGARMAATQHASAVMTNNSIIDAIRPMLPERGAPGSEMNYERSKMIGVRLHEAKLAGETGA